MNKQQRCKDCVCLVDLNGEWFCDEYDKNCRDIDECGEWDKEKK